MVLGKSASMLIGSKVSDMAYTRVLSFTLWGLVREKVYREVDNTLWTSLQLSVEVITRSEEKLKVKGHVFRR